MAPLRSRANRNQGDDESSILKGLPIRQWHQTEERIAPHVEAKPDLGKQSFPEHPLPRDFNMLPEISQHLLRRARAGHIYHSPKPTANGKENKGKKDGKDAEGGFVSKKWTLVARDQEAEEPSFLAKRRRGLPPTFGVSLPALVPQASYRTAKVKKYDAEGKLHVYEVLAPEGQKVEGEVVAEDEAAKAAPVEPIAAAPGTVVEGIGIVNEQGVVVSNDLLQPTPPRRKPPPPRRKPKKGPGRGKKKVLFENGGDSGAATQAEGTPTGSGGLLNVPGVAADTATSAGSAAPSSQGDTPMPDAGDDDEGSGSEGEEGEDGDADREEGELSPTPDEVNKSASADLALPPAPTSAPTSAPSSDAKPVVADAEPVVGGIAKEVNQTEPVAEDQDVKMEDAPEAVPVVKEPESLPAPVEPAPPAVTAEAAPIAIPGLPPPSIPLPKFITNDENEAIVPDPVDLPPAAIEPATEEAVPSQEISLAEEISIPTIPQPPPPAARAEAIPGISIPTTEAPAPAPSAPVPVIEEPVKAEEAAPPPDAEASVEVDLLAKPETTVEKEPEAPTEPEKPVVDTEEKKEAET